MKITVIGLGKVGMEITRRLCEEGHDILVIDKDESKLSKIYENNLDVIAMKGNGSSARILKSPEVAGSDLLVAVTNSDEINMIACMMAKKMDIPRTVARIRDPDHARDLIVSKEDMGLDLVVNPEYAAAMEISRLLTVALPVHTELFGDGKILMADITMDENMTAFIGKKLKDVELPRACLIVAISRRGEMVIPGGKDIIMPGDTIYLLGHSDSVNKFCLKIKKKKQKMQDVIILGGGRISYYLAEKLNSQGIRVKIIEQNLERCRDLAESLPETLVLQGDGSDIDTLKREGIKETDGFVAVTGIDEENLLLALLAKQIGAKRVVAKVSRPSYTTLVERLGVDAAISPRLNMVSEILRFIRGGRLLSLFLLLNGQAEVFELIVQPGTKIAGKALKNSGMPKGVIIGAIVRGEEAIIPEGNDVIMENDRLVVFALGHIMHNIESLFNLGGSPLEQKPYY
ncbi:Trk system potassium transporter TrkA [Pelotomaculum terephthalicicum JT]|uniref:Trk system potassium transporter TrkA n=1 Tax=Pelotomaculum terephthalicicum TaxID=206393 RepID=UPI001F04B7C5|nr:Trk system potassium transporter TrkA [Pelotomaculum terephthalicicum]MCG9968232.1 Trk system potassium transporter TrkA [Pelotomaculum terephthalicicum JT]